MKPATPARPPHSLPRLARLLARNHGWSTTKASGLLRQIREGSHPDTRHSCAVVLRAALKVRHGA